jgi:hypothetical protein
MQIHKILFHIKYPNRWLSQASSSALSRRKSCKAERSIWASTRKVIGSSPMVRPAKTPGLLGRNRKVRSHSVWTVFKHNCILTIWTPGRVCRVYEQLNDTAVFGCYDSLALRSNYHWPLRGGRTKPHDIFDKFLRLPCSLVSLSFGVRPCHPKLFACSW